MSHPLARLQADLNAHFSDLGLSPGQVPALAPAKAESADWALPFHHLDPEEQAQLSLPPWAESFHWSQGFLNFRLRPAYLWRSFDEPWPMPKIDVEGGWELRFWKGAALIRRPRKELRRFFNYLQAMPQMQVEKTLLKAPDLSDFDHQLVQATWWLMECLHVQREPWPAAGLAQALSRYAQAFGRFWASQVIDDSQEGMAFRLKMLSRQHEWLTALMPEIGSEAIV